MHLSDTSSIAQHLKNIHAQQHNYEKFSPTTQQYSNIKIIDKNFRFSKHYILETGNQHLIELIFKPVLMYLNVFRYWHYLQNYISKQTPLSLTAKTSLHNSNLLKQKLHHFVTDSPLMIAQSRAESTWDTFNYGKYLNQFPPNTIKVIREFRRIQKKICRHKISTMFNEICINEEMLPIYIYIYIYAEAWIGVWIPATGS